MYSSLGGSGEKKKKGHVHLEINQLSIHAPSIGSIPKQFGSASNLYSYQPKKNNQNQLPSIGLGQLHIKLAQQTSNAAPAEKGASFIDNEETTHSFIQNTWSTFSNLSDSHRNQLLKGLLSRSSSQQIEFICTCLNIKSLDNGTPGNPVPTKVFPETVLGKYLVNSRRKPESYHLKNEVTSTIKKTKNEESFKEAMKRAFGNEEDAQKVDDTTTDFMSSSDTGSFLNSNTYIKLMNSNMSPESLSKQIAFASPEGIKFLTHFLSKQCTRFQKILKSMDEISKQPELEKSTEKLFDLMLDVTDAKFATIYYSSTPGSPVKVHNNNWPYTRTVVNEDQIFASESVFKGDLVNVYNYGASDLYKPSQSSHYHSVDPTCVLSAPFYGDGLRVTGILELIGKKSGSPLFTAEEEFILQSLASIATILFNQLTIKQSSNKKNDNLKSFLETTSVLPVAKIEMGDLVEVVMNSARELVNADRCTLYLYDEETDELWSRLAHGSEQIRFPSDVGMAGAVFQSGKLINTQDAYSDFRFNQVIDKTSGYKTHTILSVPMINHENEVIGVIQAINKLPLGIAFHDDDIIQLQSFATVAATTLHKSNQIYELSTLVQEQMQALHYYKCMLQTGNDVSITIGADSRASSIENAHLIGFDHLKHLMYTTSFEHWLGRQNHAIAGAISKVKSTNKPITVYYHTFYMPDRTPLAVSYYVRRLIYTGHDDNNLLPNGKVSDIVKKSTLVPNAPGGGKRLSRSGKHSIAAKSSESVDTTNAPFGILLIITPIIPNKIMIDQLACQLDQKTVAEFILEPAKLDGEQQPVTSFAVNIRRFSALIKNLPPTKVNLLLNRYFEILTTTANSYEASLTDNNGSFATITFGVPFPGPNDASRAVDCALAVHKALVELNKKTEDVGLPTIHISIGISSGVGLCGAVGPAKMKKYTVMGNPVDDSIDMQWIANQYGAGVLVDINTKELIKDSYHLREVDLITYGQHSNLTLFEIMASTEDDTDHDILTTVISYELGLAEYRSKNWQAAIMHFKKSQTLTDDHPSKYMIERCRALIDGKFELAEDWAGGWVLDKN